MTSTTMNKMTVAPYGSWRSPITAELVAQSGLSLQTVLLDGENVYWIEGRPQEKGRNVVVRRDPAGKVSDLTSSSFNVRTRVHEYGGGAALVAEGVLYFSNYSDGTFYKQEADQAAEPITSNPRARYADVILDARRQRLIGVREEHGEGGEPVNELVALALDGHRVERVLVSGSDFYSSPRLSPDGTSLAWLSWHHPNMPWIGTELWVGSFDGDGQIAGQRLVAGSAEESIFQPEWSPDGVLHFISDRSGWWNLYRETGNGAKNLLPLEAEFGRAQWVFGMSTYGWISPTQLFCSYQQKGLGRLAVLDLVSGLRKEIPSVYTEYAQIRVKGAEVFMLAGAPDRPTSLVRLRWDREEFTVLRGSSPETSGESLKEYLSLPRFIEFPSGARTVFGWYYPPQNRDYSGAAEEKPPLIVKSHGGPTSAASSTLSLKTQYWTSRGYAVLDVDYGGSTGYGRDYRGLLHRQWGVIDVEDCVSGLHFLVEKGWVDGNRAMITGGSAGGYTTLSVLTFTRAFRAGASHYGVSDLLALTRETHKFESCYLDWLIGPHPQESELYRMRSPLFHTERLSVPIIFFQGEEDKVVPPNQSSLMADALRKKGLPVGYLLFHGEGHGFRQAKNIERALEAELAFFDSLVVKSGLQF